MYTNIYSEMVEALSRLSLMVRGVGNPLVAAYTRCYLCRVSVYTLLHLIQLIIYSNSAPYAYTYVHEMYSEPVLYKTLIIIIN